MELKKEEKKEEEQQEQMSDDELAELANKELRKRDEEITKLKKELNKAKLYSTATEEEDKPMSKEDCIKAISDSRTSNYDYAVAVVGLVDAEIAEGNPNPLGEDGKEVRDFFEECIKECGDDKSRFTAVYQSKIGDDPVDIAMAYKRRNK